MGESISSDTAPLLARLTASLRNSLRFFRGEPYIIQCPHGIAAKAFAARYHEIRRNRALITCVRYVVHGNAIAGLDTNFMKLSEAPES
jgi:hypothetical protein